MTPEESTGTATMSAMMGTRLGDREWEMTRTMDAPPERVYRAWTDPVDLREWFGPKSFTNPVVEVDLRAGGRFRIVMRDPDGVDYPATGVYHEIVPNEKLVYSDSLNESPPEFLDQVNEMRGQPKGSAIPDPIATITFAEKDGGTDLRLHYVWESEADREAFLKIQMAEGWAESLDVLEEYLAAE